MLVIGITKSVGAIGQDLWISSSLLVRRSLLFLNLPVLCYGPQLQAKNKMACQISLKLQTLTFFLLFLMLLKRQSD